jgi:hypothetical protein
LIVALRFGIHLYYGIGYAAVIVVPWMIGAWLLYRAIGTIWPLIIGHALYDAALLTTMRTSQAWASPALWTVAWIGAVLVLATVARWRIRHAGSRPPGRRHRFTVDSLRARARSTTDRQGTSASESVGYRAESGRSMGGY